VHRRAVGIDAKYVLPRFVDVSVRNRETARVRGDWVPHARGVVLEIGIGSGLNLPFYAGEVSRIYGVEPSPELRMLARKRAVGKGIDVELLSQCAEEPLPLPDQSIDTVVITWTLCSIAEPTRPLRHIKGVLKPSGRLIFVEHGRAPDAGVEVWQDRLTPLWKRIGGGCHLNRKIDDMLLDAGFAIDELKMKYLRGSRPMTYSY
jgi:ubiquinone/menaquinone biosynthesis C-methylase UbiE